MKKCYKAFKNACYGTNDALQKHSVSHVNATLSGTTACFVIVKDKTVYVGSTGMRVGCIHNVHCCAHMLANTNVICTYGCWYVSINMDTYVHNKETHCNPTQPNR